MMGYRDRTFCTDKSCKKFNTCKTALTKVVDTAAREWWGKPNYPIAMFAGRIECYEGDPNIPFDIMSQGERQ